MSDIKYIIKRITTVIEVISIFLRAFCLSIISPIKYIWKYLTFIHHNESSFNLNNSTTAPDLPFTPSFCIVFDIWFLTVFSLIFNFDAISFVLKFWIKSSKTSLSRSVNIPLINSTLSLLYILSHNILCCSTF